MFCKKYGSVAARSLGPKFSGLVTLTKNPHPWHPPKPTQLLSKVTFATSLRAFQSFSEFITAKLDECSIGIIYQNNSVDNVKQLDSREVKKIIASSDH